MLNENIGADLIVDLRRLYAARPREAEGERLTIRPIN